MGYSLSRAAVKNGKPEAIHSALALRATGVFERIPESKMARASLPTGWYLVSRKRNEPGHHILAKLSSMGEIVCCFVEDHVMFSRACGWKDGKFILSVPHDCEKGRYHPEIKGGTPTSLKGIHVKLGAAEDAAGGKEAEVDFVYDVWPELAKHLTGFRQDQDMPGMDDKPFQVLEKKDLFSRFFGERN